MQFEMSCSQECRPIQELSTKQWWEPFAYLLQQVQMQALHGCRALGSFQQQAMGPHEAPTALKCRQRRAMEVMLWKML